MPQERLITAFGWCALRDRPLPSFYISLETASKSLCDLNFLGLWPQVRIDWSSTIKEEIQEAVNQSIEKKKSKPTNQVVWFSVLTTLALLGTAI